MTTPLLTDSWHSHTVLHHRYSEPLMRIRSLVLAPALLLAAQAVRAQEGTTSPQDIERAALIAMKSDLRNLVTAQEAYFADHSAYASEMDGLKFRNSQNVTVRLTATQNNGWAAET